MTGFSGSGKTTFITSLIYQLTHYKNSLLPAFSALLQNRVLGIKLHTNKQLPLFPYEQSIQYLSKIPPQWPNPTTGISSCLLELRLKAKPSLLRGSSNKRIQSIFIDIKDYPWRMAYGFAHAFFKL